MTVVSDLQAACSAAVDRILFLENALEEADATITGMTQTINDRDATIAALTAERDQLQSDLADAMATIADMQDVAEQRDAIIVCLSDKVDELEAKLLTCDCPEEANDPVSLLAGKTIYGAVAKPGTLAAFDAFESIVNEPQESRRIFLSGDLDWTVDTAAGRIPIVEVPLGISTAALEDLAADLLADGKPNVCTIGHEEERPEKNQTAAYFKSEVARISPYLQGVPNVSVIVTYMNGSARGQIAGVDIADWLPPAEQIDAIGFDVYVGNPTNLPFNSHDNVLRPGLQIAHDLGVPLMYPEFGVGGNASVRSAYVQGVIDWIAQVRAGTKTFPTMTDAGRFVALIVEWFHSNIGGNPPATPFGNTWEIDKAADGVDTMTPGVWKTAIQNNGWDLL